MAVPFILLKEKSLAFAKATLFMTGDLKKMYWQKKRWRRTHRSVSRLFEIQKKAFYTSTPTNASKTDEWSFVILGC